MVVATFFLPFDEKAPLQKSCTELQDNDLSVFGSSNKTTKSLLYFRLI